MSNNLDDDDTDASRLRITDDPENASVGDGLNRITAQDRNTTANGDNDL